MKGRHRKSAVTQNGALLVWLFLEVFLKLRGVLFLGTVVHSFFTEDSSNEVESGASYSESDSGGLQNSLNEYDDDFFPEIISSDDIAYFFSKNDLEGLHWALTNIFFRSERNPNLPKSKRKPLSSLLVSRGGGSIYTTQYKLEADLNQALYIVDQLQNSDEKTANYFRDVVIPIYQKVLQNIPPLEQLQKTKGLYAFTRSDYELGIENVYNKALYVTTSDELDPQWRKRGVLNSDLNFEEIQKKWFGESKNVTNADSRGDFVTSEPLPGVVIIDDLLHPTTLSLLRRLLLLNTLFFQTKTPLQFGKYTGAYIDDGLHDLLFLQLAFDLHRSMPRIFEGHDLKYMWAYKYDSEHEEGIRLHADQAAVNVNIWLSEDESNLDHDSGGLVVYTAKPPADWDFQSYNTDTEFVIEKLLKPTKFANVTIPHKQNRAVMFDSALFHQTDRYKFKKGHDKSRINLTLLFGDMHLSDGNQSENSGSADGGVNVKVKKEL